MSKRPRGARRRAKAAFALVAALLLFSAATALAQVPTAPPPAPPEPASTAAPAAPDSATALNDATIVAIFDAWNTRDLQTGALAGERAMSREVRDYGRMLARDHRAVRQQGRNLVKKLGVKPTPPADSTNAVAHAKALRELGALRGRAFDKAFLAHEVEYHAQVLDAVNDKVLPAIQNAELKALVERVAPAFEAHMQAARALQKKLKLE